MTWIFLLLVGAAALSLLRIVVSWRKVAKAPTSDWDERFIAQLRKAGVAPFEAYPVDFFFDLPSQGACDEVSAELDADGFTTSSRAEADTGRYSLHANRSMRLLVPDMQALTARFRALAEAKGGKYDGWAVAKSKT